MTGSDRKPRRQAGTQPQAGSRTPTAQTSAQRLTWKGGTLEAPLPAVLVSCGTMDKPNVMTVAWTGIVNTDPPMTYVSIRPERYSYDIIHNSREFVINLPTAQMARTVDYCGVKRYRQDRRLPPESAARRNGPCPFDRGVSSAAGMFGAPGDGSRVTSHVSRGYPRGPCRSVPCGHVRTAPDR